MAALCLDLELENCARRDLHDWLGGAWALLFSNPEDFQPYSGRAKEPWLDDLRQEFGVRGVRVLAVKRDRGPPESSWVDELHSDRQLVRLREPSFAAGDELSFAARALRGELLTLRSRYVLFIDGSLKRRDVLKYSAGRSAVSASDLLASVDAVRYHRSIGRAA